MQFEEIGAFWVIYVPVQPDNVGWAVKAILWRKGDDAEFTHKFGKDIPDARAKVLEGIVTC